MVETNNDAKKTLRRIPFKALKATIKGVVIYAIYFILWTFIAPISQIIPGLQQMMETFVMVCIIFIVAEELTSGTIYHYFFNVGKALFVIGYLIGTLNGGIFSIRFQNINLIVDLRLVLAITMLLGLLGLAKSVLQTINYINEKTEHANIWF
jgi:F0F1-type ATP synthase assembly protein I